MATKRTKPSVNALNAAVDAAAARKREYERGSTEGAQQLDAAREAAAEAFDSALLHQLAAVTEQRDDLLAVLRGFAKMETPTERADRLEGTGEEYDHDDNIIVLGHLIEAARTATTKAEGRRRGVSRAARGRDQGVGRRPGEQLT